MQCKEGKFQAAFLKSYEDSGYFIGYKTKKPGSDNSAQLAFWCACGSSSIENIPSCMVYFYTMHESPSQAIYYVGI